MLEGQGEYFTFLDDEYGNPLSGAAKITMKDMALFSQTVNKIKNEGTNVYTALECYNNENGCSRTIDIGHVDIEYEWFLMKATTKVKVKHKYVTEVKEGRVDIEDVSDSKYQSEIIAKVIPYEPTHTNFI